MIAKKTDQTTVNGGLAKLTFAEVVDRINNKDLQSVTVTRRIERDKDTHAIKTYTDRKGLVQPSRKTWAKLTFKDGRTYNTGVRHTVDSLADRGLVPGPSGFAAYYTADICPINGVKTVMCQYADGKTYEVLEFF